MRTVATALVGVALLTGCSAAASVEPQACEQELTTAAFRVCLPSDAEVVVSEDRTASATVGSYEVHLRQSDPQPGDVDQAAFAVLADLQRQVGRTIPDASSPDPLALGAEGPIDVAGADGAFQSLDAAYDTGDVDDVVTWGRGLVAEGAAAAVVVVRRFDVDTEVSADQADRARDEAMPIVVTLALRGTGR